MDAESGEGGSSGNGATLLDLAAGVGGVAVAASLVRTGLLGAEAEGLAGRAFWFWTLAWIGLTSAGPWVFLARRFARRPPGYPAAGDRLWAILGLPWSLAALLRVIEGTTGGGEVASSSLLVAGVALGSLMAAGEAWSRSWGETDEPTRERPWTERIGLGLAVAFPIQWGLVLTVLAGDG